MSEILNLCPWIEKYRPTNFKNIVLDPLNKEIMVNIIKNNYFPNLLLYGPSGTGKTTTIINLVDEYQKNNNQRNKGLMIHLNASDERGIDIIRTTINQFVNSKSLFNKGTKFVILDEVDYMTKNAQQALKYLLQCYNKNVRFCLICNYISRIDDSLQNEFMRLRFNQLPKKNIIEFLSNISDNEKLELSTETLESIQELYKSDIRSMINYMQSNQNMIHNKKVIGNNVWESLTTSIKKNDINNSVNYLESISKEYNIEIKNIIKNYLNYIIRNDTNKITKEYLNFVEFIMHLHEPNIEYLKIYSITSLKELFK
jgi:DNA polymerase III delta prime subunit